MGNEGVSLIQTPTSPNQFVGNRQETWELISTDYREAKMTDKMLQHVSHKGYAGAESKDTLYLAYKVRIKDNRGRFIPSILFFEISKHTYRVGCHNASVTYLSLSGKQQIWKSNIGHFPIGRADGILEPGKLDRIIAYAWSGPYNVLNWFHTSMLGPANRFRKK
ncbi:MAG: hypothetical protein KJ732_06325 [Candidatus Margulisbacteria bacterium]|nr:hypothetical protein [Candidatus Margulisiibacteriota bacterium]